MHRFRIGSLAAVAVVAMAACAGSDESGSPTTLTSPSTAATPTTEPASQTTAATVETTVAPPTTAVPESTTPPTASPTTAVAAGPLAAMKSTMESFVDEQGLNGAALVLVDRDDGIVHEEYVGEFSADRVSLVASSSKMITAGVLLRLHDDGLIDIDAPVADAVDWGAGNPNITPAQLLSNSSGLVGLGPNPAYGPYVCQFLPDREIEECAAEVFNTPDDDGDIVPPDTEYRYGGVQWQVAGALAEAVSGSSWDELIQNIYIEPCGVESLGYNNHWFGAGGFAYPADFDPAALATTENPHMEGGAFINPTDYAKLLLMHLRGGMCDGGQVLSAESVDRAHADRVAEAYGDNADASPGYGMGWWVNRDTGIISDGGAYGSQPWLDLEDGYGAYLVIEASSDLGQQLFRELEPIVEAFMTSRS